jgi:hypothetical protein
MNNNNKIACENAEKNPAASAVLVYKISLIIITPYNHLTLLFVQFHPIFNETSCNFIFSIASVKELPGLFSNADFTIVFYIKY